MKGLDQRGAVFLEFIVVGTALIMLIFGGLEFGRGLNTYLVLTNAAREGARYKALPNTTDAQAKCWTVRSAPGYADATNPCDPNVQVAQGNKCVLTVNNVTVAADTVDNEPAFKVTIAYNHGLFFAPVPGVTQGTDCLGRASFALSVSVSMRDEGN